MKTKQFFDYTVSDTGLVFNKKGKFIRPYLCSGYYRLEIYNQGKAKKYFVHQLVALSFIPNPEGKPQVNHLNGIKTDNRVENLEWCTRSENQKHAYRLGLQKGYRKSIPLSESHKAALCGSRWRGQKRIYWVDGIPFNTPKEAASQFGVSRQCFYDRASSPKFPGWFIEVKKC